MELEEIYRRDLNLLVALQILIEERSVSKAAVRLSLSQSAMSRVLGRLRELLDDPLFTRQGAQLIPTEKALEFNAELGEPLQRLRCILSPSNFEPKRCEQAFRVATTDYAMQTILPFALPRIYQEAPNVAFEFVPLQHDRLAQQLTYDGVDLAIGRLIGAGDQLRSHSLGRVGVSCLLSQQHPCADQALTLDDYLNFPHAMIAISDGVKNLLDKALETQPKRKVVLRTYHLEAALAIADTIPLIITVPADLAYLVAERYNLIVKTLPFEFTPFEYSMLWHPRSDFSPAQEWLRATVEEECGKLIAKRVQEVGLV